MIQKVDLVERQKNQDAIRQNLGEIAAALNQGIGKRDGLTHSMVNLLNRYAEGKGGNSMERMAKGRAVHELVACLKLIGNGAAILRKELPDLPMSPALDALAKLKDLSKDAQLLDDPDCRLLRAQVAAIGKTAVSDLAAVEQSHRPQEGHT